MVYFLVNNSFHLYEVDRFADEIKYHQLGLIQVPYSLRFVENDTRFKHIFCFERFPFTFEYLKSFWKGFVPAVLDNIIKMRNIKRLLKIEKDDILFVFTETELLNQILINHFNKRGAKICLLEDGTASAIYYNLPTEPISKRALIFKWFVQIFFGIKGFNPYYRDNQYYPMMADSYFSAACFFLPILIKRDIPRFVIKKVSLKKFPCLNEEFAIFLNEPIYNYYVDFETYIKNLLEILENICENFKKVYFKFHPDEINSGIYLKISEYFCVIGNIEIIKTNEIVENIISKYRAKIVISYFSSALNNLLFYGLEPVYLFHMIDFLKNNDSLKQLELCLKGLDYNFIKSIKDINPEYSSGLEREPDNSNDINELLAYLSA